MLELLSISGDVHTQDEVLIDVHINGHLKRLLVKSKDVIALSKVSPPLEPFEEPLGWRDGEEEKL